MRIVDSSTYLYFICASSRSPSLIEYESAVNAQNTVTNGSNVAGNASKKATEALYIR
jgi:hypothetical protein